MKRVTQAEFARLCGVNRSTVSRWLKSGRIEADAKGLIDPQAAARLREATESPLPHHQARKAQFEADRQPHTPQTQAAAPEAATERPNVGESSSERIGLALKLETYKERKIKAEAAALAVTRLAETLIERAEFDRLLRSFTAIRSAAFARLRQTLPATLAACHGDTNAIHATLSDAMHDVLHEIAGRLTEEPSA